MYETTHSLARESCFSNETNEIVRSNFVQLNFFPTASSPLDYKGIYGNNVAHFYFSLTTLNYLRWYMPQGETRVHLLCRPLGKKAFLRFTYEKSSVPRQRKSIEKCHKFGTRFLVQTYVRLNSRVVFGKMKSLFVF